MRTTLLSLAAAAALGVAALAPTAASAAYWHHGYHPHHRPHFGRIFFVPRLYAPAYAYGACVYRNASSDPWAVARASGPGLLLKQRVPVPGAGPHPRGRGFACPGGFAMILRWRVCRHSSSQHESSSFHG